MPRSTDYEQRGLRGERDRGADEAVLPHERLEVYGVAVQLHGALMPLVPRRGSRDLKDQLERAGTSVVLNIAEGAGRFQRADERRFFEIARASATEVAAIIDLVRLRQLASGDDCRFARNLAVRVVQMLSRLTLNLR